MSRSPCKAVRYRQWGCSFPFLENRWSERDIFYMAAASYVLCLRGVLIRCVAWSYWRTSRAVICSRRTCCWPSAWPWRPRLKERISSPRRASRSAFSSFLIFQANATRTFEARSVLWYLALAWVGYYAYRLVWLCVCFHSLLGVPVCQARHEWA